MKKRLLIVIALALVLVLALTLIACDGSKEQTPQGGAPSTPDGGQPPETPDGGEQTPETPDEGDEGETPVPPVTYTVTFETNGGSAVQPVTVDEGDAVAAAPETTLDGYEFGGWYSSADLSDDSLVTFPYTPAGSTTLYAKWSKILTAADLYNEVFGEDYAFVSFENFLQQIANTNFDNYLENEILFVDTANTFQLYVDCKISYGRQILMNVRYKGESLNNILYYAETSNEINSLGSFKNYILKMIEDRDYMIDETAEVLAQLQNQKLLIEENANIINNLTKSDFSRTNLITNTTNEIEFADFAAKFMPAGVTPIACYVEDCGARNIDSKYFNSGYYCMVDIALVYENTNGTIAVSQHTFIVKALNNQEASESIYNRLLNGNETTDYVVSNVDTTTIENPIWTGYTVGVAK